MDQNVEINGYSFFAHDWKADESQEGHEINRLKIMNGTEAVTLGAYTPMEWSFKTHVLHLDEYDKYDKMITELHDNIVEVFAPEIHDKFNAYCHITKIPLRKWFRLEFKLLQVKDSSRYALKNRMYDKPFVSIYSAREMSKTYKNVG